MGVRLRFGFHNVYLSLILILKHKTTGKHPTACAPALGPSGWRCTALMERPWVPGSASPLAVHGPASSLLGHCIPTSELLLRWPPSRPSLPFPSCLGQVSWAEGQPHGLPSLPLTSGSLTAPSRAKRLLHGVSHSACPTSASLGAMVGWGPVQCLRHKAEAQQRG